jgi:hypothetical protein
MNTSPERAALVVACIPAALVVAVVALPIIAVGVLRKRASRWLRLRDGL